MTIAITSLGSKVKVIVEGVTDHYHPEKANVDITYKPAGFISLWFEHTEEGTFERRVLSFQNIPLADFSLGGIVITDETVFDDRMEVVFPEANTGNGGSGSVNSLDDVPQGSLHKWFSASDYTILQQLISSFTS